MVSYCLHCQGLHKKGKRKARKCCILLCTYCSAAPRKGYETKSGICNKVHVRIYKENLRTLFALSTYVSTTILDLHYNKKFNVLRFFYIFFSTFRIYLLLHLLNCQPIYHPVQLFQYQMQNPVQYQVENVHLVS